MKSIKIVEKFFSIAIDMIFSSNPYCQILQIRLKA